VRAGARIKLPGGIAIALAGVAWVAPLPAADCPPRGHDRASLESLRAAKFEMPVDADRHALALALIPCLAHPDPGLRDGTAFEASAAWLRAGQLDVATRVRMYARLVEMLKPAADDREGFRQPFAALVLSEVARTDRLDPWMEPGQRAQLVEEGARYLSDVRDYRGFDEREGWRHGVAHGADLVTQLVLNPGVDRASVDRLLGAVASQVTPPGEHAYVDGEPERLARAVVFAAQRKLHTADEWQAWLSKVAEPAPLPDWGASFQSRAGLTKRHNLLGFLYALYVNASESGDAGMQALLPGLREVFKTL
jgi:hypothetical protein